jgi:glycolate oxidase iron-sulfur subunit
LGTVHGPAAAGGDVVSRHPLLQPEISRELRARKVATLEERAPQVIAAGNIGCMMQIGSATAVPVVHTAELLDWATGGPRPAALGAA